MNDRVLLPAVGLLFAAFALVIALSGGATTGITAGIAIGVGVVVAAVAQWELSRRGHLILRDPADRLANARKVLRARNRFAPGAVGVGIAGATLLNAHGHLRLVGVAAAELLCGLILGFWPVLLWIAFRLRPDKHRGERL